MQKRPDIITAQKSWSFGKAGWYYTKSARPHNVIDNVQSMQELIKWTSALVAVRPVNIIQRQSDLIKSKRLPIFWQADKSCTKSVIL